VTEETESDVGSHAYARQAPTATPARRGTISQVTSRPAAAWHLRDATVLHRVRDWIEREYAQPLHVEALDGGVHLSAGHLSREFRRAYGESPYGVRDCAVRDEGARARHVGELRPFAPFGCLRSRRIVKSNGRSLEPAASSLQ
jgi:AraC-like DNA-binding protein